MAISLGAVSVAVIPNMAQFKSEVEAGVTSTAAQAEAGAATATEAGTVKGAEAGAVAAGRSSSVKKHFSGFAKMAGTLIAFELAKTSIEAADQYELGIKKLRESLIRAHLGAELPSLEEWTKKFSDQTGIAQGDLLKLETQLTTAGLKGAGNVENITNAVEGLSQETGKSVSMFSRSLIPSLLNDPKSAISQLEKWHILTGSQVTELTKLTKAGHDQKASQIELNAVMKKGMDAYQSTPLEHFKVQMQNVQIQLGKFLLPILDQMAKALITVLSWMEKGGPTVKYLALAIGGLAAALYIVRKAMLLVEAAEWLVDAANPFLLIAAAAGVAAVLIITHWNTVKRWVLAFWHWLKDGWGKYLLLIFGPVGLVAFAAVEVIKHWNGVKNWVLGFWHWFYDGWGKFLLLIFGPIGLVALAAIEAIKHWRGIKTVAVDVWHAIYKSAMTVKNFMVRMWHDVETAFSKAMAFIKRMWNDTIGHLPGLHIGKGGGFSVGGLVQNLSHLVPFAEGGIVTQPTLALMGERREPEAVVPLSKWGDFGGGGGNAFTLRIIDWEHGIAQVRTLSRDEQAQFLTHQDTLSRMNRKG